MNIDVSKLAPYAKAVAAVVGWAATVLALYISLTADGNLSAEDAVALLSALLGGGATAGAVFGVKNKKES